MSNQQNSGSNTPTPDPGNNAEEGSREINSVQGSHHSESEEVEPLVLELLDWSLDNIEIIDLLYERISYYTFHISSWFGHANHTVEVQILDIKNTLMDQQEVLAEAMQQVQTGSIEVQHLRSENVRTEIMYDDINSQLQEIMNADRLHMIEQLRENGTGLSAAQLQSLEQLQEENETGLSEAQLQSLPTTHISIQEVEESTRCNVCLIDFTEGETVCQLSCSHLYHSHCITRWLTTKTTCPTCRRNLQEESTER